MSKTHLTGPAPEPTVYLFEDDGTVYHYDSLQALAEDLGRWLSVHPHFRSYTWDDKWQVLRENHHRFIARQGGDIIEDETLKALLPPYQTYASRCREARGQPSHLKRRAPVPFTSDTWHQNPIRDLHKHRMLKELFFEEDETPPVRKKLKERYRYQLRHRRMRQVKNWKQYRPHQWKA